MIKNDLQLAVAQKKVESLTTDIAALGDMAADRMHRRLLGRVQRDIAEYIEISSGRMKDFPFGDVAELPELLVKARIAAGLTQKDLAERIGVAPQSVQRDEKGAYETAQFDRIVEVIDAMGFVLEGCLKPHVDEEAGTLLAISGFAVRMPESPAASRGNRSIRFEECVTT